MDLEVEMCSGPRSVPGLADVADDGAGGDVAIDGAVGGEMGAVVVVAVVAPEVPREPANAVGSELDDTVDWVCADGYNWAPVEPHASWDHVDVIYEAFYAWGLERGKPMMVGEWGVLDITADPYTSGDSGAVIMRAFQSVDIKARHEESFSAMQDALTP